MDTGNPGKLTDHVSLGALTRIAPRFIVDEVLTESKSRKSGSVRLGRSARRPGHEGRSKPRRL